MTKKLAILKSTVPDVRIVDFPGAGQHEFLTKEADVLREVRAFIAAVGATVQAAVPLDPIGRDRGPAVDSYARFRLAAGRATPTFAGLFFLVLTASRLF